MTAKKKSKDPNSVQIGARIKRLRTTAGLSQVKLALAAGLPEHWGAKICSAETGKIPLGDRALGEVAAALDVTVAYLEHGKGSADLSDKVWPNRTFTATPERKRVAKKAPKRKPVPAKKGQSTAPDSEIITFTIPGSLVEFAERYDVTFRHVHLMMKIARTMGQKLVTVSEWSNYYRVVTNSSFTIVLGSKIDD